MLNRRDIAIGLPTHKSYWTDRLVSIVSYSHTFLMIIASASQFNIKKALVEAFSVITNLRVDLRSKLY